MSISHILSLLGLRISRYGLLSLSGLFVNNCGNQIRDIRDPTSSNDSCECSHPVISTQSISSLSTSMSGLSAVYATQPRCITGNMLALQPSALGTDRSRSARRYISLSHHAKKRLLGGPRFTVLNQHPNHTSPLFSL